MHKESPVHAPPFAADGSELVLVQTSTSARSITLTNRRWIRALATGTETGRALARDVAIKVYREISSLACLLSEGCCSGIAELAYALGVTGAGNIKFFLVLALSRNSLRI